MVYTFSVFSLQNAVCFIILTYLVPVLFTFYIQGVLKLKKINSGAKRLKVRHWIADRSVDILPGQCFIPSYSFTEYSRPDFEWFLRVSMLDVIFKVRSFSAD